MPCLALSAKPESVSVYSDPSTQRGLPFALLLTLNRQKSSAHPSFYTEVSSRNSSFITVREATQIQQADSTQWLLLDHGTKDSGLSFLHTTTDTVVHLL